VEPDRPKIESFKVETPVGSFESDSGNHAVDVLSVGAMILLVYILKRVWYN
tara:strand:+ start:1195 stop:1347 length:153 start_codon:yes stop_codon:yes gene_type:complete